MSGILVLAIGKMKSGALADALKEYQKRMRVKVTVQEIDLRDCDAAKLQEKESKALLAAIPKDSFVVALDERGKTLKSRDFAAKMRGWRETSGKTIVFLIGGADGHTDFLRKKANFVLSFGEMTWPHMLARVMLMEQLYRAEAISSGHPYHRD